MTRVFIDTSDLETAIAVREAIQDGEYEIEMVADAGEIRSRVRSDEEPLALVLTGDLERSEADRMIEFFDSRIPRPPVLAFLDAPPDTRARVASERGVDECLGLPPDEQEVQIVLDQQLDRFELQREAGIVGRTRAIRDALDRVHLVAPVKSTVLLTGESGTGKELVARAIHHFSPRRGRPFITVNCAALPESLLESELFGHEKGAFTGATSRREGMFELADGGSIFLDEIAEMPPSTQTRLLRVLEQRRFMRVGGDTEIEVNVRVIAATNRDLKRAVQQGDFRRDLYYRLNVLHIELPPLRRRKEDIPVLVRRFVQQFSADHERDFKGLAPEAMKLLLEYDWPGNVRELRNLVESMVVLAPGSIIRAEDIPAEIRTGSGQSLLPVRAGGESLDVPATRPNAGDEGARIPEMEFIFRTLIDLKVDMEDLRREFERYRESHPELLESGRARYRGQEIEIPTHAAPEEMAEALEAEFHRVERETGEEGGARAEPTAREGGDSDEEARTEATSGDDAPSAGFEFRPGMSMAEVEREAIVATLKAVDGNRRRAAERLGIGERTLYRKLREYDIDL